MLGTLILPSSSSLPIFSDETNYFQSQLEPVHKYSLEKIDKNIFNQALNEREELGEKLSTEINKWIFSAMAEDKQLFINSSVSNNRLIPRLQSRGKRSVIHYNSKRTAIHLPRIRTAIEEIGHRWRTARRIVRKGLMSKILRTKQNLKPVSYNISSCKESGTSSTSQNSDGSDSVPQTALEQKSVVNKAPQRKLFTTNGGQITGNENFIRVCTPDLVLCWSCLHQEF